MATRASTTAQRTARPVRRRVWGVALAGLDLGASFTNVPGGTANWTFTDVTGNYNDASGTAAIVINKADATIMVTATPASTTARRTARRVRRRVCGGVDAARGLNLGASFTNVPGGTANWTFTDVTGNYNDAERHGRDRDQQGERDGRGQRLHRASTTARRTARRARRRAWRSEALAGLDLGASFTNVPGGTANWTFTDVTGNYNDAERHGARS